MSLGTGVLLLFILGLSCLCSAPAVADEATEIRLASGFDLQALQHPAQGQSLLIWLPSKYGVRAGHSDFAAAVQNAGVDLWLIDLHESYLLPTGRHAYQQFRPEHIKELIDHAVQQGWRRIVLGGESRGASLAMRAARLWQIENPGRTAIRGLLFYHPHLIEGYTGIGEQARFEPIARATNLPIYILQPQHSTKYLHSQELVEQLETGGAAVYFHYLQGVRGGYHIRPKVRLRPREVEERALLGDRIRNAITLLDQLPTPAQAAVQAVAPDTRPANDSDSQVALTPLHRDLVLPLRLYDDEDRLFDLEALKGEVVLVNFWASWCRPCVKEIASLMRLVETLEDQPFRVLAVNIGESQAHVAAFFRELDIQPNFDVLFDPDGEVARTWKVYAVPSNFLLDREHRVRYGHRGALRWDARDIVETVQGLLE